MKFVTVNTDRCGGGGGNVGDPICGDNGDVVGSVLDGIDTGPKV